MNLTKNQQQILQQTLDPIRSVLLDLIQADGKIFLVGGAVRDLILDRTLKDIDLEIHQLAPEKVEHILSKHGTVNEVGKKFGVFRLATFDIDWSLPRCDSKGRKPEVAVDPQMGIEAALRRRDVTMNAMAIDVGALVAQTTQAATIIDPFNGLKDLQNKTLRAVDAVTFTEDPLRLLRVAQFIGRFDMIPDKHLDILAREMSLSDPVTQAPIARERIFQEISKLLLYAKKPSRGFAWLEQVGKLSSLFPELAALRETPQRPDFHPEGDVLEHTFQAIDAAAQMSQNQTPSSIEPTMPIDEKKRLILLLGTLCHDMGKPLTQSPELTAHGHETAGIEPAKTFCHRLTHDCDIIPSVTALVRYHLMPWALHRQKSSAMAYKRLAKKLAPHLSFYELALVAYADSCGRNPIKGTPLSSSHISFADLIAQAEQAGVLHLAEPAILSGKDFLESLPPGPLLGRAVRLAYAIQIEESITDPQKLKQAALDRLHQIFDY